MKFFRQEKTLFVQFLQIVVLCMCLSLEILSYQSDRLWNKTVKKRKSPELICPWLTQQVDKARFEQLIKPIQTKIGDENDDDYENRRKTRDSIGQHQLEEKDYLVQNIMRDSRQEKAAMALIVLSILFLTIHLILACISSNYEYRTKWAATVQGLVLFLMAFSAMFLATTAHDYMSVTRVLGRRIPECDLLGWCRHQEESQANLESFLKKQGFNSETVNKTSGKVLNLIEDVGMCPKFQYKIVAAAMCGCVIVLCLVVVCLAMDLTTIYAEEDVDEEELERRRAFKKHEVLAQLAEELKGPSEPPTVEAIIKQKEEIEAQRPTKAPANEPTSFKGFGTRDPRASIMSSAFVNPLRKRITTPEAKKKAQAVQANKKKEEKTD